MNDNKSCYYPPCPKSCPCPILLELVASITHEEEALAAIMNAESCKINRVVDSCNNYEVLLAVNASVQTTLEQIAAIECELKAKLDSIIPLLSHCN